MNNPTPASGVPDDSCDGVNCCERPSPSALRASAGSIGIDPSLPCQMGCGDTREAIAVVQDPLEINALVLRHHETVCVIVTLDALYVGDDLRSCVISELEHALRPEELFLAASHTHYAPFLDRSKPLLGAVSSQHLADVSRRCAVLIKRLLEDEGEPVSIESVRYETFAPINRRMYRLVGGAEGRVRFRSVFLGPNKEGTGTQYGHLVQLVGESGPVAIVWQLPCHPTSLPEGWGHSAHFVGEGRGFLRELVGAPVPVLFVQGFSGDLRPASVGVAVTRSDRVRRRLLGEWFVPFGPDEYQAWLSGVTAELAAAYKKLKPSSSSEISVHRAEEPLSLYYSGVEEGKHMICHTIAFGDVAIVGLSAEPVSGYAAHLTSRRRRMYIPAGCIDDVVGYGPTELMLNEGGYEGGAFLKYFGAEGVKPGFQTRLLRLMLDGAI